MTPDCALNICAWLGCSTCEWNRPYGRGARPAIFIRHRVALLYPAFAGSGEIGPHPASECRLLQTTDGQRCHGEWIPGLLTKEPGEELVRAAYVTHVVRREEAVTSKAVRRQGTRQTVSRRIARVVVRYHRLTRHAKIMSEVLHTL